jgi:hypothetical protein
MGNSTLEFILVRVIITTRGIGVQVVFDTMLKKNPDKYLRVLICQAESRKEALELEALFVTQELVDDPMCYNLKTGGLGGSHAKRSAETKAKISAARKGTTQSYEQKAKLSARMKGNQYGRGKLHSDESKAKMSAFRKGRTLSEETKAKLSAANKGRTFSDESKAKMSAAQKGKPQSKVECPHCQKTGGPGAMKQWHFDNCKSR